MRYRLLTFDSFLLFYRQMLMIAWSIVSTYNLLVHIWRHILIVYFENTFTFVPLELHYVLSYFRTHILLVVESDVFTWLYRTIIFGRMSTLDTFTRLYRIASKVSDPNQVKWTGYPSKRSESVQEYL